MKLVDIANQLNLSFKGDPETVVKQFYSKDCPLENSVAYADNKKQLSNLNYDNISVVIMSSENAKKYSGNCIIDDNPYYAFSKVSLILSPKIIPDYSIHPTAYVSSKAKLASNVVIGPHCVIQDFVEIGENSILEAGCIISNNVKIGANAYLFSRVTINHSCIIGSHVRIQSGAVIGSEGFGYARHPDGWSRIAHTGKVIIGKNVEIGANTTIDRGTVDNTVIEDGVILDNLIQIAHNVHIGKNTALAGCVGVAGSAKIGANCTFGGSTTVLGHLTIVDNVHITSTSLVTKSITQAGQYSSGGLLEKTSVWRKNAIRFKQLNELFKRIKN